MTKKFSVHIKCDTNDAIKEELREVAEIITGLRMASLKFHNEFGYHNKIERQKWEKRADDWINKHKVFY